MEGRENRALFDKGMAKAKELVRAHVTGLLERCCDLLVQGALEEKSGFRNLTGNTVTGYACGLYVGGKLSYFVCSGSSMKKPVRVKLGKGETFAGIGYDGERRRFTGKVDTDKGYGADFSYRFLQGYKPQAGSAFEIVACTGTEYSTYLENVLDADVLTGLFRKAPDVLAKNFKPMGR